MARRDGDTGERAAQRRRHPALVLGVPEREEERHGHRLRSERPHRSHDPLDLAFGERLERAAGPHALRDSDHVVARDERRRVIACQIVQ